MEGLEVGRRGVLTFTATALASAAWLLFGLGSTLATLTAAASGGRCFVGGLAFSWHAPDPEADFGPSMPVSMAAIAGAVVAAAATGVSRVARRLALSPLLAPLLALVVAVGGLAPFVACRWEVRSGGGAFPFMLLPLGLTAAVACGTVVVVNWLTEAGRTSAARAAQRSGAA